MPDNKPGSGGGLPAFAGGAGRDLLELEEAVQKLEQEEALLSVTSGTPLSFRRKPDTDPDKSGVRVTVKSDADADLDPDISAEAADFDDNLDGLYNSNILEPQEDTPYDNLSRILNNILTKPPETREAFNEKMHNQILPLMAFVVAGAKQNYEQNKTPENKAVMENFQKIQRQLEAFYVLSKNRGILSKKEYAKFRNDIGSIGSKDLQESLDTLLLARLGKSKFYEKYEGAKGSMGAKLWGPSEEEKVTNFGWNRFSPGRGLKITYKGDMIRANFSYGRNSLLGIKMFGRRKSAIAALREQISDFAAISLSQGFGKQNKPFDIKYDPADKKIPEAALSMLVELKKRAILSGEAIYAKDHTGTVILITSKPEFEPNELAYFKHFADQKVEKKNMEGVTVRDTEWQKLSLRYTEKTIGYKLFKYDEDDVLKFGGMKPEDDIAHVMTSYLKKETRTVKKLDETLGLQPPSPSSEARKSNESKGSQEDNDRESLLVVRRGPSAKA